MVREARPIYRFGDYTLEVSEHRLRRGDREIYLPPKTFEMLSYLLERHSHLVKKNELLDALWADTTVTENTLTHCIEEVRKALGDDARHPRFIQTIPRVGYKFIAAVEKLSSSAEEEEAVEEGITPVRVQVTKTSDSDAVTGGVGDAASIPVSPRPRVPVSLRAPTLFHRRSLIGALVLVGLVALVAVWYLGHQEKSSLSFAERDWLLVVDFDNRTGEEVFGVALRSALERELSRSRYVNAVPQDRVLDTLALMKRDPDTKITEAVGREVCLRDGGIRALLSGGIQEIGGVYAITVKLTDPTTGVTVASLAEEAKGRPEVLSAIRRLAGEVREALGESLVSITKSDQHLERVTTPSLEALELYSKGWSFVNRLGRADWERARDFMSQAVERDPTFAMAHLMLGYAYWRLGPMSEARGQMQQAVDLAQGVTDRERYFILGSQALAFSDVQQAIKHLELLVQLYPDDYWGHNNLSEAYERIGDRQRWREHQQASARIRPNYATNHWRLGLFALFEEGDVERAHAEFARLLELNPEYPRPLAHLSGAFRDWMGGDLGSAETKMSAVLSTGMRLALPDSQITARWWPARLYLFTGKGGSALEQLEGSLALARQQKNANLAAWSQLELGLTYGELGDTDRFEVLMKTTGAESVGLARINALGWLGISVARAGRASHGRRLRDELQQENREPPVDAFHPSLEGELDLAKRAFSAQIEGEIALAQGNLVQAIERFKQTIELVPPSGRAALTALDPRLYLVANQSLARAHEQREEWDAATSAYQAILDHKSLTIIAPASSSLWVRTLWLISDALEKKGDAEKAASYREQFLRLWPEADRSATQISPRNRRQMR